MAMAGQDPRVRGDPTGSHHEEKAQVRWRPLWLPCGFWRVLAPAARFLLGLSFGPRLASLNSAHTVPDEKGKKKKKGRGKLASREPTAQTC